MSGDLDRDRTDAGLEERLRASFRATRVPEAPPTIRRHISEIISSEQSRNRGTVRPSTWAAWLGAAMVLLVTVSVVVLGAALLSGADHLPASSGQPSRSSSTSSPTNAGALRQYTGNGWVFDYPSSWTFYPFQMTTSFFTTIGYLGSTAVDTSAICSRSSSGGSCDLHGYELPPGNVVVGLASWGPPTIDPVSFFDNPKQGTRVTVGDMPAVFSEEPAFPNGVRLTWKVARPDAFGNWIQLEADILGPGEDHLRQQVETMVSSFRFVPAPKPLPAGRDAANAIAARGVTTLQASEPAAYACFPAQPGTMRAATVLDLPDSMLKKPLPVRCSTTIDRTDIGFWKLELVASWDAAADRLAGSWTTVQWLYPDGTGSASTGFGDSIPYCCR